MTPMSESSDDALKAERIATTVQRETARQRRLIRLYGLLLLVPLILGGTFLLWGRTDRQVVRSEVQQQVAPVVAAYQEIRPALSATRVLDTVLPSLRTAAQRLDHQDAQVAALTARQDSLTAQVQPWGSTLERYGSTLTRLQASQDSLPELRAALRAVANQQGLLRDSLRSELLMSRNLVTQLGTQLRRQDSLIRILGDPSVLRRRLDLLDRQVDTLKRINRGAVHPQ